MELVSAFDDGSIRLDARFLDGHLAPEDAEAAQPEVERSMDLLYSRRGPGAEFTGWLEPGSVFPDEELYRLRKTAERLRANTQCLVVVGIGGSYLGARACYEALRKSGSQYVLRFAGVNLSSHYHHDLLESLRGVDFAVNVVSKSGTTLEPAVAFRLLRSELERRHGKSEAGRFIVATTDRRKGFLRKLATEEGWETFDVPENIGGRYSVLTSAGILPLAYTGVDVDALIGGATECAVACRDQHIARNPARLYAALRHVLQKKGLAIELLATFEPRFEQFVEWWKQLFGESHGKNGKGLFPAGAVYTRDLHSLGQWVQDGPRVLFETFLDIEGGEKPLTIPSDGSPVTDGLDFVSGCELADVNRKVKDAVRAAHAEGGCPNLTVSVPYVDEYHLGVLIYFFEFVCAVTGYMSGVNPFDQPGVEVYKRNMFNLLGKPGL